MSDTKPFKGSKGSPDITIGHSSSLRQSVFHFLKNRFFKKSLLPLHKIHPHPVFVRLDNKSFFNRKTPRKSLKQVSD